MIIEPDNAADAEPDNAADRRFMREALALATRGEGFVEPNPMVGCVLVKSGQIMGRGYHRQFGQPHAEIEALRSLVSATDARGSTAYVTLEPCCHHGKTPPCTRSLIDAGVARVVIAAKDPFPQVDGSGISQLKSAGIDVCVGVLEIEAEQIIAPFTKRIRTGMPWVIAKWAMTMDGRIATRTGDSQWISCQASRNQVHQLRSRVDAIVVGMGTVIADDPMLSARQDDATPDQPFPKRIATRIVMCRRRLPSPDSKLMQSCHQFPTLLVTTPDVDPEKLAELKSLGADCLATEEPADRASTGSETEKPHQTAEPRHVDGNRDNMVLQMLRHLADQGATNVMIEGGSQILSSFFSAGQIDEAHVFIGPKLFGGIEACGPVGGVGVALVADAGQFTLRNVDSFDDDVRLIYRRK